jgi:hypothetical protein
VRVNEVEIFGEGSVGGVHMRRGKQNIVQISKMLTNPENSLIFSGTFWI